MKNSILIDVLTGAVIALFFMWHAPLMLLIFIGISGSLCATASWVLNG